MKKALLLIVTLSLTLVPLLAIEQGDPTALVDEARQAIKNWNLAEANAKYQEAMKSTADQDEYNKILAAWKDLEQVKVLMADGKREFDRREYKSALKKYQAAEEKMRSFKDSIWNKGIAEALYSQGMVYWRIDQGIQAADRFRRAIQVYPEEPKYQKAILALRGSHYNEGNKYLKRRDYENAQKEYEQAVAIDPQFAKAYYQLGYLLKRKGDYQKAEEYYSKAIESDPNYYLGWYGLGLLKSEQGALAEATRDLEKAVKLKPNYYKAYYQLAKVYDDRHKTKLAISNLKKALKLKPNYVRALELLAKIYNEQEQYAKTVALLKDKRGKATSFRTYFYLAHAYNALKKYPEALKAAKKSLQLKRNWAAALMEKGDALAGMRKKKEAIAAYKKAARLDARWRSVAEYRINELTKWQNQ